MQPVSLLGLDFKDLLVADSTIECFAGLEAAHFFDGGNDRQDFPEDDRGLRLAFLPISLGRCSGRWDNGGACSPTAATPATAITG